MESHGRKVFETDRTRRWRANTLTSQEAVKLAHIEQFGSSVLLIKASKAGPAFAYSVGVYDTSGKPEVITVGLQQDTAHHLVNEAARRLRDGVDLTIGRHRELVGEVECEFRPVAAKWVEHLMGWATWYYGGDDLPVLQAIYPDLENRFQWEDGFHTRFAQPLLQSGAPVTRVEEDFWASADPASSLFDWKFADDPHTLAYLSKAVNEKREPVTYVSHDVEDGAWQFLGDSMTERGGVMVCMHHPVDADRSLAELADLPLGWYAERERPGGPWVRRESPPSDDGEA